LAAILWRSGRFAILVFLRSILAGNTGVGSTLSRFKCLPSDPRIMGYLRNNSIFAFGQADRARTSPTVREILDAMWLFNSKFGRALSKFDEMKAR
jgi:hypothetical protein